MVICYSIHSKLITSKIMKLGICNSFFASWFSVLFRSSNPEARLNLFGYCAHLWTFVRKLSIVYYSKSTKINLEMNAPRQFSK